MSDPSLTSAELNDLTWGWWLTLLIGVLSVVAGVIVLLKPSNSLATLAVISGIFVLFDGIVAIVLSLTHAVESRGLAAVVGVVSLIVGVLLIRHPFTGVSAVALLLACWLIAAGVVRLILAIEVPENRLRGIAVGLVLGAAGVIIAASPDIGYKTLALITGLGFIGYGVGMMLLGWAMHAVRHADAPPRAALG